MSYLSWNGIYLSFEILLLKKMPQIMKTVKQCERTGNRWVNKRREKKTNWDKKTCHIELLINRYVHNMGAYIFTHVTP